MPKVTKNDMETSRIVSIINLPLRSACRVRGFIRILTTMNKEADISIMSSFVTYTTAVCSSLSVDCSTAIGMTDYTA